MRAGLELWARRAGVRLDVVDDESKPERAVRIHQELAARGCRFVLGPYGSDSTREVAEARAGSVCEKRISITRVSGTWTTNRFPCSVRT